MGLHLLGRVEMNMVEMDGIMEKSIQKGKFLLCL